MGDDQFIMTTTVVQFQTLVSGCFSWVHLWHWHASLCDIKYQQKPINALVDHLILGVGSKVALISEVFMNIKYDTEQKDIWQLTQDTSYLMILGPFMALLCHLW